MTDTSNIGKRRAAALEKNSTGYNARRQEIINAAAQVFKVRGYRGTKLADIAKVLGVDRVSLYYYISSKDEIFEEVVTAVVMSNTEHIIEIRDSSIPVEQKLRHTIEHVMSAYAENYPFLYVYLQENLSHVAPNRMEWASKMREVNRRYTQALVDIIQQGYDSGTFRDVAPPSVVANGVLGMVSWTNRWFDPNRSEVTAEVIGRGYADIIIDGLTKT
jgi:AcrR family transcriptional regulator